MDGATNGRIGGNKYGKMDVWMDGQRNGWSD